MDVIQHIVIDKNNDAGWRAYWTAVWGHADMKTKVDQIDFEQFALWARSRSDGGSAASLVLANSQAK